MSKSSNHPERLKAASQNSNVIMAPAAKHLVSEVNFSFTREFTLEIDPLSAIMRIVNKASFLLLA